MAKQPINLVHYDDGTPSVMRKRTLYSELYFYRKSNVLLQLTKAFCRRFLPQYHDRTVDQMVQAARSIKQNIAEGLTDGQTSFEVEIKLLGIAKGSNQELLEDYWDYIRQHDIPEWAEKNSVRYEKMRQFCLQNHDESAYHRYFSLWSDEEMANVAICLCHMVDKAMTTFLEKRDREFVEEGGIRERMTAARLEMRGTQKQQIAHQETLITALKKQIAAQEKTIADQQREIFALKAQIAQLRGQVE